MNTVTDMTDNGSLIANISGRVSRNFEKFLFFGAGSAAAAGSTVSFLTAPDGASFSQKFQMAGYAALAGVLGAVLSAPFTQAAMQKFGHIGPGQDTDFSFKDTEKLKVAMIAGAILSSFTVASYKSYSQNHNPQETAQVQNAAVPETQNAVMVQGQKINFKPE